MPKTGFERNKAQGGVQRGTPANKKRGFRKTSDTAPTWDAVPKEIVSAIVCCTTTQGASPTFGYTANGSSLTIAIYDKGDRMIDYLSGTDEVAEYLAWLIREYFDLGDEEAKYYGLGPSVVA